MTTLVDAVNDGTARDWTAQGSALLLAAVQALGDDELDAPSALPGWSRRHLLAHVAANAEALGRLLSWARTGVESRMYATPAQRAADIAAGALLPADRLRAWLARAVDDLERAAAELPQPAWSAQVLTAQGRTVQARQVPWLRAREVNIHAVDLATGVGFSDLPPAFCAALVEDVSTWRSAAATGPALALTASDTSGSWSVAGSGAPHRIALPVADLAAWLTGRAGRPDLPTLPAWL